MAIAFLTTSRAANGQQASQIGAIGFLNHSRAQQFGTAAAAEVDVQAVPSTHMTNSRTAAAAAAVPSAAAAAGRSRTAAVAGNSTSAAAAEVQAALSTDTASSRTAAAAGAVPSEISPRGELIDYIMSQVGSGSMTVKQMSNLADKISPCISGPPLPLAGMRERDLHTYCMRQPWRAYLPDLYAFSMRKRVRGADCDKLRNATHMALLPHELFANIEAHSILAEELLTGGDDNLRQWWADAARCKGPWFEQLCQSAPCTAAAARAASAAATVGCTAAASGVHTAAAAVGCTAAAAAGVHAASAMGLDRGPAAAAAGGTAAAAAGAYAAMGFDRCVPIGMHGDDAGGHGSDKVTVITWGSVALVNSTLDSRLVFSMLKESEAPAGTGLDRLLQVLAWSFNALSEGVYPSADQDGKAFGPDHHPRRAASAGKPLSDRGFRGVWTEFRGDWKFLKEAMHLKEHYHTGGDVCHRCAATHHGPDPEMWYTNFGQCANLRDTLHEPADYLKSAAAARHPSQLLKIRDFCISRVFFDIMHTLDLGVLQIAIPSALAELLGVNSQSATEKLKASSIFGRGRCSQEQRFANATRHYKLWAKRHNLPMHYAQFSKSWTQGSYPQITQYQAKAAELRSMQYWMRDVCVESAAAGEHGPHGQVRAQLFEAFVKVDETCRDGGRHLLPAAADALAAAMEHALLMYNALAANAFEQGRQLWKFIPKHHALTHIAYDGHGTNPRAVHCYADEDMVGRMKKIYVKCHGRTAPFRSIQRYIILVGQRWHQYVRPLSTRLRPKPASRKWRVPKQIWGKSGRLVAATFRS
jgi:hypothetical protein